MSNILIVEDQPESRYLLEQLLASRGHQIAAAENGEQALDMARTNPPEVIISDIMMPVMNGFKLCCEIKKDPDLRQIPFIFYSATFVDDADRDLAMSLGASRFVIKPTEGDQFIQILEDVLKEHRNGVLPVPEGPIEDQEVLIEMYENSLARKLAETVEKLQDERRALIQSERRLKEAQELAHIGHWELDLKTNALQWSDEIFRILGVKPRAFDPSYQTLMTMDVIHPDDRGFVLKAHKEALSKKTPSDIEYRLLLKDGNVKYINERFQTIFDDGGMPACAMGTVQDITERKQAQEVKRESEERYKILFEEARDGICIADAETGIIIDCNPALAALVEREQTELIGQPQSVLHPPQETAEDLSPTFREHLSRKEGETLEAQVITRTGTIRDVEIKANGVNLTGRRALQGIFRDVTARKEAACALRENEEKYRSLVENAREVILVAQEGHIKFLNQRAFDLLGYVPEGLVGKPFVDLIHPEDRQLVAERHFKRLKGDELPGVYPFRVIHKSGQIRWVEINAIRIEWEGRPATLNFLADITERKEAEAEREKLEAQLLQAQKLEAVGRLASGVAHDFNNLLTVILGYGDMALQDLNPHHPHYSLLKEICDAGKKARNLTRQLLAFSRKQVLEMEPLDVNEVVKGFEKLLRRVIGEDVHLKIALHDNPVRIKGDVSQLEQVLMNLAVNARDAMPGGGTLTIETGNVELDDVYVSNKPGLVAGSYAMIAVTDTGVGMDSETLGQIFEPFFTTKDREKGTGLGLATSYGIVKQHGGDIHVYSEPDQGTTFRIYIPLASGEEKTEPQIVGTPRPVIGRGAILVVEDDPQVLRLAGDILRAGGYHVLQADDPEKALDLARSHKEALDLILADVILPRMKGPDLVERIREIHSEARVVFMSGYSEEMIAHKGILFLPKPFTARGLWEKVAEALGKP